MIVKAETTCSEPVSSIDFLPTICEAVGVDAPDDRVIDGRSIMPLLTRTGSLKREAIYWHFPHYRGNDVEPYSIVRAGDWKLIKRYEGKTYELFDLRNDLSETADLAERLPQKVRELDAMLVAWVDNVCAKMPQAQPKLRGRLIESSIAVCSPEPGKRRKRITFLCPYLSRD